MMIVLSLLRIIIIILIILLILTQTVTLKFSRASSILLEINLTFFSFSFEFKNEDKERRKSISLREKLSDLSLILRTLKLGLSKSIVVIHSFSPFDISDNSEKRFLLNGIASIPCSLLLAYISDAAAAFRYESSPSTASTSISATAHTSLIHLILTASFYFKERLKIKYKARKRR